MAEKNDDRGREATKPTEIPKRGWLDVTKRAQKEAKQDNVPLMAAGLAYYAFLAIFPAAFAALTLWALFAEPDTLARQIQSMTANLPPDTAAVIEPLLSNAAERAGSALSIGAVVGVLGALWSASGGVNGLVKAINAAYDEDETRGFVKLRGLSLVFTIGAIVGVLLAVALIAVVPVILDNLGLGPVGEFLARWGRWPLLAALVLLGLGIVYRYAPDRDNPQFKWVTPGATVATVLWLVGSGLFSLFVTNFGNYGATYGTFAGIIVLLLWLYLTGYVILLGAEINAELESQTARDTTVGEEKPLGTRRAEAADTVAPPAG